jgi:hypothetical protein
MRKLMLAAAFVLTGALSPAAQPAGQPATQPGLRPGAQPGLVPAQPLQPVQPRPLPVTAARMTQLEEEFELAEAGRDVKRAHLKVAELGVRGAEIEVERLNRLAANGIVDKETLEKAKLDVDVAKVQVEVRGAELKEAEVKVKYAKKRLDEAKAVGVRPAPGVPAPPVPVPVDPNS